MIGIIDYGMGNLGSINNMFNRLGVDSIVTGDPTVIEAAEKLILPGVGAFDTAMERLGGLALIPLLNRKVLEMKTPILGICLGMQLLSKRSEEGKLPGLGWIDAETLKFHFEPGTAALKVPHMGWNTLSIRKSSALFDSMFPEPRFYFVHSYHVRCNSAEDVLALSHYGIDFHAAVLCGNIMGTQFHPEKSHKYGLKLLQNFAEMTP
jgi:imidazole glycerol-phosphate synthase subunit HisH